jgi:hypothetical protein
LDAITDVIGDKWKHIVLAFEPNNDFVIENGENSNDDAVNCKNVKDFPKVSE